MLLVIQSAMLVRRGRSWRVALLSMGAVALAGSGAPSCKKFGQVRETPVGGASRGGDDSAAGAASDGEAIGGNRGDSTGRSSNLAGMSEGGPEQNLGVGGQSGASGEGGVGEPFGGGSSGGERGELIPVEKSPSDFDGLVLWLRATEAHCPTDEAGRIARCLDGSENSNDAVSEGLEHQPILIDNVINGHGVISFQPQVVDEGSDAPDVLLVADSESLRLGTQDFIYALVGSWTNPTSISYLDYGYGTAVSKQDPFPPYSGVALVANYPGITPGTPTMARFAFQATTHGAVVLSQDLNLNDGVTRLCVARRVGAELELRINGAVDGKVRTTSVLDVSMPGQPVRIGGRPGSAFVGEIAEVVIIRGKTSDDDVAALERGLMGKFGL
jgi:hypothetical protein